MPETTIQKGWLYTRDGDRFAPETLIENVTTRSGKPYDERVREYLSALNSKIENIKIETGNNYDGEIRDLKDKDQELAGAIATLQEIDNTHSNAINQFNGLIADLQSTDTELVNKLQYFDGSASDKLYIVDNNNNVAAYIDGTGVHAIDFINRDSISFNEQMQWFNGSGDNTFFFIDNNDNVVAYIDGNGIHSTEYTHQDGKTFSWVIEQLNTFNAKIIEYDSAISALQDKDREFAVAIPIIQDKDREQDERLSDLEDKDSEFEDKLQYLNYEEAPDAFYFIDSSSDKKVAAKIAGDGIDAVDFRAKSGDKNYSLISLGNQVQDISGQVSINTANIGTNRTDINGLLSRVGQNEIDIGTNSTNISNLQTRMTPIEQGVEESKVAIANLEGNLKTYYGYEDLEQDAFYFIDNNKNVVAMINANGITTTNVTFGNEKNIKRNVMFFEKQGTVTMNI